MKSGKMFVLLACLLSLGICVVAHAADEEDEGVAPMGKMQTVASSNHISEDLGYAIGLKFWLNEWSLPVRIRSWNKGFGAALLQFESDPEIAFIPTFMVRYRNFFFGGSYMPKIEYEFSTQSIFSANFLGVDSDINVSAERTEWDMNLGYMITPNIALSLGYKALKRSYDLQESLSDGTDRVSLGSDSLDESLNAPILGLSAVFPIKGKLNLYNSFAYGWISGDADGYYYLGEVGINYVIPLTQKMVSAIIINFGYRWQRLDLDYDYSSGDQNDTTSGFNLGVTAPF